MRKKSEREADAAAKARPGAQTAPPPDAEAARNETRAARSETSAARGETSRALRGDAPPRRRPPARAADERSAAPRRDDDRTNTSRRDEDRAKISRHDDRAKISRHDADDSNASRHAEDRPAATRRGEARAGGSRRDERRTGAAGEQKKRAGPPRGGERRAAARGEEAATPARRAAAELLRRVEAEGAFASVLLAHAAAALSPEDRALCYELTLGVLRWQLWLDRLIEHYAGRGAETLDAPVRRALRLGLYQLRFLTRVPQSAAVNESVKLTREANHASAAGLVNAVLRRATREPNFDPASTARTETERIAVATSHPAWLVGRWAAAFGAREAAAFARANNRTPPVAFRVNPLRAAESEVMERLRAAGVEVEPSRVAQGAWRVTAGGGEPLRALAAEGAAYTQDEASQLAARLVGARAGELILDACAAPGSKATQIGAETRDAALVVAGDLYGHRLRTVVESAARQGLENVRAVAFDAEAGPLPFAAETFDRVLVDAPCTGTGTLRHNPEIRWRLRPEDIAELASRQARILANCARMLRRGGRLVYSTCSVEPEENEQVVAQFLESHADFRQTRADAPGELLTGAGAARTWPHRDDADGFYVAVLERS